jgi:proteasome activator subunit 4
MVSLFVYQTIFLIRPEIFRMSELSDNPELQSHSQAVLYILSAVAPPPESIEAIGDSFVRAISFSTVRAPLNQVGSMTYSN